MIVLNDAIRIRTRGELDILDLTDQVAGIVKKSGLQNGRVTIFVPGSTAGLTTIEFESGAVSDLRAAIERMAPRDIEYAHNARWGDGNGHSHVRAALLGPDLNVPVVDGRLALGTWQQIVLVDCDNRPRNRELVVSVIGE